MKIGEFVENNQAVLPQEIADILYKEASIWTNDACCGYFIVAMESAGYSKQDITKLIPHLRMAFDAYTVEEAEERYTHY